MNKAQMRSIFLIMCMLLLSRGSEMTKQAQGTAFTGCVDGENVTKKNIAMERLHYAELESDLVLEATGEPTGSDKSEEEEIELMIKDKQQILEKVYKSALKEASIFELTRLDNKYKKHFLTDEKIAQLEKETVEAKKNGAASFGNTGYTEIIPSSDGSEAFYVRKLPNVKDARQKDEKMKKLRDEREMYLKMKNIKGVVEFHENLCNNNGELVLEGMNVDGFEILNSMVQNKKQASNHFVMKLLQLLEPLAEIHELGIAHNDICVENIMFKNQWKLIDFDLATENLKKFLASGRETYWSPQHQKQYEYRYPGANVFEKFKSHDYSIDLKKEDVYALGITVLLFMAPDLTIRLLDEKQTKYFFGTYLPLAKYLAHEGQVRMNWQRKCHTMKDYDGKFCTWESYHNWLTSFIENSEIYHPKIKEIVKKMLHPNPLERISAAEAKQLLHEIRK